MKENDDGPDDAHRGDDSADAGDIQREANAAKGSLQYALMTFDDDGCPNHAD